MFLLFCFTGVAQVLGIKTLKGKITAVDGDITGVVVQNINLDRATITDLDGKFEIAVRLNDTLVFSALQFKKKRLPISAALMNTSLVSVVLEPFVNQLREVTVNPYGLTGQLGKDIGRIPLGKDVSAEGLGLPNAEVKIITQSQRKLFEATSGIGLVPLNPILNAITGRTKMLKNRVKIESTYARTQRVQKFYVDSIIEADLKIPRSKIADFMYYCEVDPEFQAMVDTQDHLKIWDFLVLKSKYYRKNNGLLDERKKE
ncbi:Hypothetical protein I595_3582 [Croceitalea dokdonensis DOKDO 023]|uniref:Uncharacterized protein n=1 Tax=Croceitalea dokdonensis DOKDO 023 TaxID=1300341 RepID=A0A0P7AB27_9FLAO|nr:Hypothetical protein I595_3582 [Croceitalea dokdonensis DOKDO 023]